MYLNRSSKISLALVIFLIGLSGYFNLLDYYLELRVWYSVFAFLIYVELCIIFFVFTRQISFNPGMRKDITCILAMLVLWRIMEALLNNLFSYTEDPAGRLIWYAYYIPTTFIPTCFMFSFLRSVRRPKDTLPRQWYLAIPVSAIFSVLVMTNDLHHLVFRFIGVPLEYSYGPLYYAVMAWVFIQTVIGVWNLYRGIRVRHLQKYIRILYLGLLMMVLYFAWWMTGQRIFPWLAHMYDLVEVWTILLLGSYVVATLMGIVRTNSNAGELLENTGISLSVYDSKAMRFHSQSLTPTTSEQRRRAAIRPEYIDPDHRLMSHAIRGGRCYWIEDLTQINAINRRIRELSERLSHENNLLRAEEEIRVRRTRTEENERLYSLLTEKARPQLDAIEVLMKEADPSDPEAFGRTLARACVYKVYIKRAANLILLGQEAWKLHIFELQASLQESADYLSLSGVHAVCEVSGNEEHPAQVLLCLYMIFQHAVEAAFDGLKCVTAQIREETTALSMTLILSGTGLEAAFDRLIGVETEETREAGGSLRIMQGDGELTALAEFGGEGGMR